MGTSLERLDSALFLPLNVEESAMILGGADHFTDIGVCYIEGTLTRENEIDHDAPPADEFEYCYVE